jgi:hypothetical protein
VTLPILSACLQRLLLIIGEADDIRFRSRTVNGFALMHNKEVVHMAAFAE